MRYLDKIDEYLDESIKTLQAIEEQDKDLSAIADKIAETREKDGTIYIMGNGGSASTASHMTGDLLKTAIRAGEKRFKVMSLSDNVPVVLAWANDAAYETVFEEQLKNFLTKKDLVIGISGSGNSKNVLNAIGYANKTGAYTIGVTGMGGGKLAQTARLSWIVPSDLMYRIEDFHLLLNHALVYAFLKAEDS